MEYTSPGRKFLSPSMMLTSLVVIMSVASIVDAQRKYRRRNDPYADTYKRNNFQDFEYEESTVMLRPEFVNTKTNITVNEGQMATLPCVVRYLGTKKVAWKRSSDAVFLTVGTFPWLKRENIQVEWKQDAGQVSHWNLIIDGVQESDAGVYECQVTDKHPIKTHINLTVKPRPPAKPSIKVSGEAYVDRNDPIKLQCNATGGPRIPEDIDWFKDGSKIYPGPGRFQHIIMTKYRSLEEHSLISSLDIDHAEMMDSGTYVCRSSDREIASLKVTVLVADTTNVKRRSDVHRKPGESSDSDDDYGQRSKAAGQTDNSSSYVCTSVITLLVVSTLSGLTVCHLS